MKLFKNFISKIKYIYITLQILYMKIEFKYLNKFLDWKRDVILGIVYRLEKLFHGREVAWAIYEIKQSASRIAMFDFFAKVFRESVEEKKRKLKPVKYRLENLRDLVEDSIFLWTTKIYLIKHINEEIAFCEELANEPPPSIRFPNEEKDKKNEEESKVDT